MTTDGTNEIRYSRWHTARTVAANALDILASAADLVLGGFGLALGFLAALAHTGHSSQFGREDALGLALLALAAFGAGRAASSLLADPAEWLRPGYGHFPGWAVPARVRDRVHDALTAQGPARTRDIAHTLDLPQSTVVCALHRLADDGHAVKVSRGMWEAASPSQDAEEGPQVPVIGGDAR